MISKKEILEIRESLENSSNPLFFFDNDVDGFCAFLILRRALGYGRGVAIKSFPDLKEQYLKKVEELHPDLIIILDKAEISTEFILGVEEKNIKVICIDHHPSSIPKEILKKIDYYNSLPSAEPTTYMAQSIFERKEDLWLAMIGCTGDVYTPSFAKSFEKEFPELFNSRVSAFEALHTTEIGKMVRMINFGLMDTTTNVLNLIKYLFKAKGPYDLLEENSYTKQFHKRYSQLNDFYNKQVEKAQGQIKQNSNLLFFSYSGNTSMSSEISNKLFFLYPEKLTVVAFKRPEKVNISIRGTKALEVTKKAIEDIPGATGGGHIEATGAMVPLDEFDKFKRRVEELANNS